VKQHLAALRVLFNWFVVKQVVPTDPALFVKGPKSSRQIGITQILEATQTRELLNSIESESVKGLRDRAAIAVMAYIRPSHRRPVMAISHQPRRF